MPTGKLVFAQLVDFLPLHAFHRCGVRYTNRKDHAPRTNFSLINLMQLTLNHPAKGINNGCVAAFALLFPHLTS